MVQKNLREWAKAENERNLSRASRNNFAKNCKKR
jgi:hypothetical protein